MNLAPVLVQRFFDANGNPLAGGQLFTYVAGTTTPQASYSNSTGTANTNPVVLDGNGYADVWLDPTLTYKFVLKDSSGALIRSVDNVTSAGGGATALLWSANTVYSQGNLVADSSGQGLLYVSLIANNQNNALSNTSSWRVYAGNVRTVSAATTLSVTDDFVRSDSTSANLIQTLPPCATTPIGKKITVKDVGTGGFYTQAKGSGSDLVGGNNTFPENMILNVSITFENNGTSWDALGNVPALSVTASKIATKAITFAQIADGTITTAQISGTAGIAGAQLTSNINLPGNNVQAGSKNVIVAQSGTNPSLAIIRGRVGSTGNVVAGEGFTVTHSAAGQYVINFTAAFSAEAVVTASPVPGSPPAHVSIVSPNSASQCGINTFSAGTPSTSTDPAAQDMGFSFIAIGPR